MLGKLKQLVGDWRRGIVGMVQSREPLPSLEAIKAKQVGKSANGRSIISYELGNGPVNILIAGGTHGNEVGTVKLVSYLIKHLSIHAASYPQLSFTLIPCLNPDGYSKAAKQPDFWQGGRVGRFNGRNVDLNRNFPVTSWQPNAQWSHGANYGQQTAVSAGEKPGSEPEIQALLQLAHIKKPVLYWAFHSAGQDVMGNDNQLSQKLAKIFHQASGYRLIGKEHWNSEKYSGSAREWCDELGMAYLEVEATTRWGSDWASQQSAILAVLHHLNLMMAKQSQG